MGLPTFNRDDGETADDVPTTEARGALIPWLPDPPNCPECQVLMKADTVYDPREVRYVHAWTCPACDTSIHRDPVHDHEPDHPRSGSNLRDVIG